MKDRHILVRMSHFFATGFGSGLSPVAPGTAGTAVAFLIALGFYQVFGSPSFLCSLVVVVLLGLGGFVASEICLQNLSEFDQKDPQAIVVDEIAGYFTAVLFVPWTIENLFLGFVLFRFFDITKLGIIRKAEQAPGGIGIMLDDLLAGFAAGVFLYLISQV